MTTGVAVIGEVGARGPFVRCSVMAKTGSRPWM